MAMKTILLQLVWCWASKMPRLTGLKPSALSAFSLFEEQAQALLSYCHFHSFLILHYIYYISQRSNTTNCFRITRLQRQHLKPSADNNVLFPLEINHRVYQIHKEGGVVNRFLTARRHFWTPWSERTHCMEKGQSVFSLSPNAPYGRVRLALRA